NVEKFFRVVAYGHRQAGLPPAFVLSVPPVAPYWGATSILKDTINLLRRRLSTESLPADESDLKSLCLIAGKPPKYVEQAFDQVEQIESLGHSSALEFLIVPNIA